MGVSFVMYTCVKMDAILHNIIGNIKLLIIFFLNILDISPKLFMSIVVWFGIVIKASWIVCLNSSTHDLWIIVMDGKGCNISDLNNYPQPTFRSTLPYPLVDRKLDI